MTAGALTCPYLPLSRLKPSGLLEYYCAFRILIYDLTSALNIEGAAVVQEVEKLFSNQKVASSIPCRSVLEQDTEPLIAPDVQCAVSGKCKMCIPCKSLWIKASAKCKCKYTKSNI